MISLPSVTNVKKDEDVAKNVTSSDQLIKAEKRHWEDYSLILKENELSYKEIGIYLQTGDIMWAKGWILDISSVIYQVRDILQSLIPLLAKEKVPFRVIRDSNAASKVLSGEDGYILGKLLSIYPVTESQAVALAKKLISVTLEFKGPEIITDRYLGGTVYTRYGTGERIVQTKEDEHSDENNDDSSNFILSTEDNLARPQIENRPCWPFCEINTEKEPKKESVLQDRYKPMFTLKRDLKGYVRRGLWLKRWWNIKWCVIKEGRQNMISDQWGRDVSDRLQWQFDLHKMLERHLPIPKVIDLFKENGDSYLVMENIKGKSLEKKIQSILKGRRWIVVPKSEQFLVLDYAIQVLEILQKMHEMGYIHRDVTPNNFIVSKDNRLFMIDLELSYWKDFKKPSPPFQLGTPGYMSPEQKNGSHPTVHQDIYAIGSLLMFMFSSLMPIKFDTKKLLILKEQLKFFIPFADLTDMICKCFDSDPQMRPEISSLRDTLIKIRDREREYPDSVYTFRLFDIGPSRNILSKFVEDGLGGMLNGKMMNGGMWCLNLEDNGIRQSEENRQLKYNYNFYNGLSGIIYTLSRIHRGGWAIDRCLGSYHASVESILDSSEEIQKHLDGGLYKGTTGMAIGLIEGVECGLIIKNNKCIDTIYSFLASENILDNSIIRGRVGKGFSLLKAYAVFNDSRIETSLKHVVNDLLLSQQQDGSWISLSDKSQLSIKVNGWGHGISGILCFLLQYCKQFPQEVACKQSSYKAVKWLINQKNGKNKTIRWPINNKVKFASREFQDGSTGVVLCLIKAYELFKDISLKNLAEQYLESCEEFMTDDMTLDSGIVGLGEVFLEAAQIFKEEKWQHRASQIAELLVHCCHHVDDNSCYWITEGSPHPTPGLMKGNIAIVHFLARCAKPDRLCHPLMFV